jgi:hypothetical protein
VILSVTVLNYAGEGQSDMIAFVSLVLFHVRGQYIFMLLSSGVDADCVKDSAFFPDICIHLPCQYK